MNITLPRAVIEQALEEWHTDPGSVRMASLMIALRTALEQPEEYRCQWVEKGQGHCERNKRMGWTEQPEQEPVWWMLKTGHGTEFKEQLTDELKALTWKGKPMWTPLYVSPPQRKPLSDDEIQALWEKAFDSGSSPRDFARAIEVAHNIKEDA